MFFESSLPLVLSCLVGTVITAILWSQTQSRWLLGAAGLLLCGGAMAFIADRLVLTDRDNNACTMTWRTKRTRARRIDSRWDGSAARATDRKRAANPPRQSRPAESHDMPLHTAAEFTAAAADVSRHIESCYGVATVPTHLPPPSKGDLDGQRIFVATTNEPEERLFLVAHLFGHTVQWNVSASSRRLGMTMPVAPDEAMLDALEAYEREACRLSLRVMHEADVTTFDQWLADYSACDLAYLRHFYTTGERRDFRRFWRAGQPLLVPLEIPPFTPQAWRRGSRAIVI